MTGRHVYYKENQGLAFELPGDYGCIVQPNGEKWWFACLPNWGKENEMEGHYVCICRPGHHTIKEHEDGTVTVSPSILWGKEQMPNNPNTWWHGYLEHGVWREC